MSNMTEDDTVSTPLSPRLSPHESHVEDHGQALELEAAASGITVDEVGRATEIKLFNCRSIQMRVFHMTWVTFFFCFFAWFGTANVFKWIQADLQLTPVDRANAGAAAVSSTIIFRLFVGWLCDRIGPRYAYTILLLCSSFPVLLMGIVHTPVGYVTIHFFIGLVGASFVITQYHTIAMFAPNVVGTATATTAGWGNLGGGFTNLLMPVFTAAIESGGTPPNLAWRYTMLIPGGLILLNAALYLYCTQDTPNGNVYEGCTRQEKDPIGALSPMQPEAPTETDTRNLFIVGASDYRAWVLHIAYACCFGVELTVLRFSAGHFRHEFHVSPQIAGLLVIFFSIPNLFARTWGGMVADKMAASRGGVNGRVRTLFVCLVGEGLMLIVFSLMNFSIVLTVITLVGFSIFVQMAEGAAMSIVPFVNPRAVGAVAGIVGAGGNVGGGAFALLLFRFVPTQISYPMAFAIMGGIVIGVSVITFALKFDDTKEAMEMAQRQAMHGAVQMQSASAGSSRFPVT